MQCKQYSVAEKSSTIVVKHYKNFNNTRIYNSNGQVFTLKGIIVRKSATFEDLGLKVAMSQNISRKSILRKMD
jgi:hypothetical protein